MAPRACVAADFADLSRAAFVAPDAGTLALPRSQWRLSPRGCTVARHALDCDGMASCLRTRRISLFGDSMMERLRSGWHKLPPESYRTLSVASVASVASPLGRDAGRTAARGVTMTRHCSPAVSI